MHVATHSMPGFAFDLKRRETKRERASFDAVRRAERHYTVQLRKVARAVGDIVKAFPADDPLSIPKMQAALHRYSELLVPWAEAVAKSMLADVSRRDERVWAQITQGMGVALRDEIRRAPTGARMQFLLADQVAEITSIPKDAAERLGKLVTEALYTGTRAAEISKEIQYSGHVSRSRADMLARTGVGTASTQLTRARAEYIQSPGYLWRTSRDSAVRESHRKMEGKFVAWDKPPTLDNYTAHAGEPANCRCWCEPIVPGVQ